MKKLLKVLAMLILFYFIFGYNWNPLIWYFNEKYIKDSGPIYSSPWHRE